MVEMRHPPDPAAFARMNTAEMRATFLAEQLFLPGKIKMMYAHVDRAVLGAAVPGHEAIRIPAPRELAAEYFAQRRELGVINIGGAGAVCVDGQEFCLENREALYIGRGSCEISFQSKECERPAQFYFVSYPAHAVYPCVKIGRREGHAADLGTTAESNRRTIYRLIHPAGIKSCQLTMGFTELSEGSVWNTMPAHTHGRRSEIYLYFDLPENGLVVHCMGEPRETRHILVRNREVIVSPNWSMHFGAGTASYSFVWAMGGENQEFTDMDMVGLI
jgi:4-deoxy-L-threo-5-hexosulose-uronate ketol-isomerase